MWLNSMLSGRARSTGSSSNPPTARAHGASASGIPTSFTPCSRKPNGSPPPDSSWSSRSSKASKSRWKAASCPGSTAPSPLENAKISQGHKEFQPRPPTVLTTLKIQHSALDSVVRAYVERSGAVDGITHAELMLTASNDATLVEIALRGGASFISSHIVPAVSGFAVGEHLIRSFSGTTTGPTSSLTRTGHNAGFHYFWSDRPMTAQELNTLRSLPDVLAAHLPEPGAEHPVGLPRHKPARLGPVAALHTDRHLRALADFAARHPPPPFHLKRDGPASRSSALLSGETVHSMHPSMPGKGQHFRMVHS